MQEYIVIENFDKAKFVAAVNNALRQGWTLQGGVSYSDVSYVGYVQAMVRNVG